MTGTYPQDASPAQLAAEFPFGEALGRRYGSDSEQTVATLQSWREQCFARVMARGWHVPFYQRLWSAAGVKPGDIRTLADISHLPTYTKADLVASVEDHPPFGDYHGPGRPHDRPHVFMHTTSGTTGTPQPLYYGIRDREIQNLLLARAYLAQGMRPDDVALSVYGFGMVNGGHYVREAVTRYAGAMLLPAGTGLETPSAQVVEMIGRYGVTTLLGFGDYLMKLAKQAQDAGEVDLQVRMISGHIHHGVRDALSQAWNGAQVFDWYGVGDTGVIAAELPSADGAVDGLTVFEDAHVVELVDPDSGNAENSDGSSVKSGNLCITCLFKDDVYPIIRFDTQDVSRLLPGRSAALPAFRQIAGFLGRSDNMVKLRGINVYPTAIAPLLEGDARLTGEYVCCLRGDDLHVLVEAADTAPAGGGTDAEAENERYAALLRQHLGVRVAVELVAAGATAALTGIESRQKPVRLVDQRETGNR